MTLSRYFLTVTDDGNTDDYCGPENVAVVLGGTVSFSCFFGNYTPDWRFTSVGDTHRNNIIFFDDNKVTDKFQPYITVNYDHNAIVELLINATQPEYAGTYECQPPPQISGVKNAQLIILGEILFFFLVIFGF